MPGLTALAWREGALALWWRSCALRRRDLGNVLENEYKGDGWGASPSAVKSSSSFSGMFGSIARPLQAGLPGYGSSMVILSGLLRLPECSGDSGLLAPLYGLIYRPEASAPGDEWARCIGGATMLPTDSGLILRGGDEARGLEGIVFCEWKGPYFGGGSELLDGNDLGEGEGDTSGSSLRGEGGNSMSSARISREEI